MFRLRHVVQTKHACLTCIQNVVTVSSDRTHQQAIAHLWSYHCKIVVFAIVASRNEASHADHMWVYGMQRDSLSYPGLKPRIIFDMYMHIVNITCILTSQMRSMSRAILKATYLYWRLRLSMKGFM